MDKRQIVRVIEGVESKMKVLSTFNLDTGTSEEASVRRRIVGELGFSQEESFYVKTRQLTVVWKDPTKVDPKAKRIDVDNLDIIALVAHEAPATLTEGEDEAFGQVLSVNISTPVRGIMQNLNKVGHQAVARWTADKMAKESKFQYFYGGRKNRLFFGTIPPEQHPWFQHFAKHADLYRNELLMVAFAARGLRLGEGKTIPMPESIVSERADGVIALITRSMGRELGYYPGCWQVRMKYPFAKGLLVVWPNDNIKPFFNTDVIKLKKKRKDGVKVMENIPAELNGDNIVAIANSDERYDMRIGHQLGYVLKNTVKSRKGAWGPMSSLIANNILARKGDHFENLPGFQTEPVALEELMPDYIRYLRSAGMPSRFMATAQQIQEAGIKDEDFRVRSTGKDLVETVLLAARPKLGKMYMFVCLPAEQVNMKPGWYRPLSGLTGPYDHSNGVARVPFMAHGGGVQEVKWAGQSPMKNVILAVVSEGLTDDVSKQVWEQIQAMGADSDGDRLVIISKQGYQMLKDAGLYIETKPETFKAKDPYPGLTEWDSESLMKYWVESTPRLANVGQGDVITRDALDAYKAGMFDWDTYYQFALHGAGEVQVGVSAPKYYFTNPYKMSAPLSGKELREAMEAAGVGAGRKLYGALYDEAREKAQEMILEFIEESPEIVTLAKGKHRKDWKGGFTAFHDTIRHFSPELGVDWPTYVRRAFFVQMQAHGITSKDVVKGISKEQGELVQKLVREYIYKYPHRINIWAWMLDERYTGVPKNEVLATIGLPTEE